MDGKRNNPYSAILIAKYFIKLAKDEGKGITNLKIQKLLYYAQGWYLANFKDQLFGDKIEAWKYGPVVPVVYSELSKYGAGYIDLPVENSEVDQIDSETKAFLKELWKVHGGLTAGDLVLASHQETPWINARNSSEDGDGEISINDIRESFEKKLKT